MKHIGDVVVGVFTKSRSWYRERSGKTRDYTNGNSSCTTKRTSFISKSKHQLTRTRDNVSEWGDISTHGWMLLGASSIKYNYVCWSSTSSSSHRNVVCSRHDIAENLVTKQQSLTHSLSILCYYGVLPGDMRVQEERVWIPVRQVRRYQRGNQNQPIEEGLSTQRPKEKGKPRQTTIYKTLHRRLSIKNIESH